MGQGVERANSNMVLVALGSNATSQAGNPHATIEAAIISLRAEFEEITVSPLYQTPAFPSGTGPDFVNAACVFHSDLDPAAILLQLHKIETIFGRERTLRWGQRTLDLDLIAVGTQVRPDVAVFNHWHALPLDAQKTSAPDTLILPHPRLQDRAFVLVPLADVAPHWRHPVLGQSIAQMLDGISDTARAEINAL